MAGLGSRFFENGYKTIKYLLNINGTSIIEQILTNFDNKEKTLLILNRRNKDFSKINEILLKLKYKNFDIVEVGDTDGQLTTVIEGYNKSRFKNENEPIWIWNGDTIRLEKLPVDLFDKKNDIDAFIEVFNETGSHWSFVDKLGIVNTVIEKKRISNYCSSGLYGFRNFNQIISYYDNNKIEKVKGELFVSSVFNNLISEEKHVFAFYTSREKFLLCGTPSEYENSKKSI